MLTKHLGKQNPIALKKAKKKNLRKEMLNKNLKKGKLIELENEKSVKNQVKE